jgi:hypothetical protein
MTIHSAQSTIRMRGTIKKWTSGRNSWLAALSNLRGYSQCAYLPLSALSGLNGEGILIPAPPSSMCRWTQIAQLASSISGERKNLAMVITHVFSLPHSHSRPMWGQLHTKLLSRYRRDPRLTWSCLGMRRRFIKNFQSSYRSPRLRHRRSCLNFMDTMYQRLPPY